MRLTVPDPSLVVLVGPSGSGKSTLARRAFPPEAVLSSDELRAVIAGDANDQAASAEAFQVLSLLLEGRLRRRLLSVVDATNLRAESRRRWLRAARRYGLPSVVIAFCYPPDTFVRLNRARPGRQVEDEVVLDQAERLRTALAELAAEGHQHVHLFSAPEEVAGAEVELVPAPTVRPAAPGGG